MEAQSSSLISRKALSSDAPHKVVTALQEVCVMIAGIRSLLRSGGLRGRGQSRPLPRCPTPSIFAGAAGAHLTAPISALSGWSFQAQSGSSTIAGMVAPRTSASRGLRSPLRRRCAADAEAAGVACSAGEHAIPGFMGRSWRAVARLRACTISPSSTPASVALGAARSLAETVLFEVRPTRADRSRRLRNFSCREHDYCVGWQRNGEPRGRERTAADERSR